MRILKWTALIFASILILGIGLFVIWALNAAQPMAESLPAMDSNETIVVQTNPWLVFQPTQKSPTTGLIFYPGGRVDPRAYAPLAYKIAENGYLVVIVPMPLNLAVFGVNQAAQVISAFPDIDHWVIGGHSLGGSMAASFADNHPDLIDGIVFLASYPANSDDLSNQDIKTLSIFGTQDGLATPIKIQASRSLLPPDTNWIAIDGGNHAQFGWYGPQSGDNKATISRAEQQEQILQATLELLASVNQGQ